MSKTVYVGNLPWEITEADIIEAFTPYGPVDSARIVTDRETGRSRGFAFVELSDDAAAKAIEGLNGSEWGGRTLTVNEAKERPNRGR